MKEYRGKNVSIGSRLEDRLKADEKKKALLARFREAKAQPQQSPPVSSSVEPAPLEPEHPQESARCSERLFGGVRYGTAKVVLYERDDPTVALHPEPWVQQLIGLMHQVYAEGGVHACLLWPAPMPPLPVVHALATWERLASGDFRGMRTLLFPTKATTFYGLNHLLADRRRIIQLVQEQGDGAGRISPVRDVAGKADLLMALSTLEIHSRDVPYPTVSELVPTFHYDSESGSWGSYSEKYLARSLKKLKSAHARSLRSKISGGLAQPETAPDALFGIPYGTRRDELRRIVSSRMFGEDQCGLDILLLDASADIQKTAFRAVQKLPEALKGFLEGMGIRVPVLLVTDDPIAFFTFRKRMREEANVDVRSHVFPAEGDGRGLAAKPRPATWIPSDRGLKYIRTEIFDREASAVALRFISAAQRFQSEHPAFQACQDAAYYLLRLSNLPGGYRDLGDWLEEEGRPDSTRQRLSWAPREARLKETLARGEAGVHSDSVAKALDSAVKLIEHWSEATPLALGLASELEESTAKKRHAIAVILPGRDYVPVAQRFLARYFAGKGYDVETLKERIDLRIHKELVSVLYGERKYQRLVFVGMTDETLRAVLTEERVPAGSVLLLSYRQAENYQKSLLGLKTLDALKPYRGRISGLADELTKRLDAMPAPLAFDRLQVRALAFSFEAPGDVPDGDEQVFWRVDLEHVGRIFVARRVFKYQPDDDPPFEPITVESLEVGDAIFVMTDDLKDRVEAAIRAKGSSNFMRETTFGRMLEAYHHEVRTRSEARFPANTLSDRIRQIQGRMKEIDPTATISAGRVRYWLDLEGNGEDGSRPPHAARDRQSFAAFARALEIPEPLLNDFWLYAINHTRKESRLAGRELADLYTSILFYPESIQVYAKLSADVIGDLQREAVKHVFRVIKIIAPQAQSYAGIGEEQVESGRRAKDTRRL